MKFSKRFLIDEVSGEALPVCAFILSSPDAPDLSELFALCKLNADADKLAKSGNSIGVFAKNRLVAACCLNFDDDPARVEAFCVAEPFRNQGLASRLMQHSASIARASKKRYLSCEIHPNNLFAVRAALHVPLMRILSLRLRSGAGLRYLLCSDALDSRLFTDFERVPLSDVYAVSRLLAKGYSSVSVHTCDDEAFLWLGK